MDRALTDAEAEAFDDIAIRYYVGATSDGGDRPPAGPADWWTRAERVGLWVLAILLPLSWVAVGGALIAGLRF